MPDLTIQLPILTERQIEAHTRFREVKKALLVRPRRWGATTLAVTLACDTMIKGHKVAWFDYHANHTFDEIFDIMKPDPDKVSVNHGVIHCPPVDVGSVHFFAPEDEPAAIGRQFDGVIVDNAIHCTKVIEAAISYAVWALVLLSDECSNDRKQEFAHLARI